MAEAVTAAPAGAAAIPAAPGEKKKLKLPLIIGAAVLLLAAIGGGAWFFSGSKPEPDAKDKGAAHADPKAAAVYVKLDPPFVVNFEAKGLMRFLQITIEIMTRDPATADLLKQHDPVIRNDLLLLFGNQTYEAISTREGKEKLLSDARTTVGKIIAREGGSAKNVEQLYFTSFVMQ